MMNRDYKTPAGAPPDWRGLCEELAGWIERSTRHHIHYPDVMYRARAALAKPVPEEPTDEELDSMEFQHWEETGVEEWGRQEAIFDHRAFARAVLARYGHQPAPPAEGEVGVLLRELRDAAFDLNGSDPAKAMLTRAADLLSQRHPAPVPVSERLPGPDDCDAEGRCWWGLEESDDYEACWTLRKMHGIPFDNTRWLPATALPLPAGEVK